MSWGAYIGVAWARAGAGGYEQRELGGHEKGDEGIGKSSLG